MYDYLKEKKYKELLEEAIKTCLVLKHEEGLDSFKKNADVQVNDKIVSSGLLRNLLHVEVYYKYVKMLFSDEIDKYTVTCITEDVELSKSPIVLSKVEIVEGIKVCLERGLFELDELGKKRLEEMSDKLNFKFFSEKISEEVFFVTIDGERFEIDAENILNFLNCSDSEYNDFFNLDKEKDIFGIPKDKFIFIVAKFVDYFDIFSNYLVPDKITERCREIESSKRIDIQAMNEIEKTYAPNIDKVNIDYNLRKEILSGMPQDVTDLEKAAYIYIKMCKLLVYDDEFFASDMKGEVAKKHENINNLQRINLNNNKVVCYEFNAIYAKLIDELGIKFEMNVNPFKTFGGGHANLDFRDGKFLVEVDAVWAVLNGDLTHAKLNQALNGFVCQNVNEKTKEEFNEKVTRMYELVVQQEQVKVGDSSKVEVEKIETFDDIMSKYRRISIFKKVDISEKFDIISEKLETSGLYKIDVFAYLLQLRKIIFSDLEQQKNFKMVVLKKDRGYVVETNAVIALNSSGFDENEEETIYYIHDGFHSRKIKKEELESWFEIGMYSYIADDDPKIPGIDVRTSRKGGGDTNAR